MTLLFEIFHDGKCGRCGWHCQNVYVAARTKKEARTLYKKEQIGVCAICSCQDLSDKKIRIILPGNMKPTLT